MSSLEQVETVKGNEILILRSMSMTVAAVWKGLATLIVVGSLCDLANAGWVSF